MTTMNSTAYVPADATVSRFESGNFSSSLSINLGFRNTTSQPIHVTTRDGISYTVLPQNVPEATSGLQVLYTVEGDNRVNFDSTNTFNAAANEVSQTQRILADAMKRQPGVGFRTNTRCLFEVSHTNLSRLGGSVYVRQLDICLSLGSVEYVEPHPYSYAGLLSQLHSEVQEVNTINTFGFSMKLVDNERVYGDRFINIGGNIYRIPTVFDEHKSSGLYVSYLGRADDKTNQIKPRTEYCTLDEIADKCPYIYKSIEDAQHHGDVIARKEEDFKRDKIAWEREKAESDRLRSSWEFEQKKLADQREADKESLKQEMDKRAADLKADKDKLDHQRTLLEQERKDHYERRNYERKDSSEMWKMVPIVIGGLLALKAIFNK